MVCSHFQFWETWRYLLMTKIDIYIFSSHLPIIGYVKPKMVILLFMDKWSPRWILMYHTGTRGQELSHWGLQDIKSILISIVFQNGP